MNLILDFPVGKESIKVFVPQPPVDRVAGCVEVFSYIYNRIRELPANILAKDLDIIVEKLSQNDPLIKINFDALMQEMILTMKPVSQFEGRDLVEGQELFNKLNEEEKETFKAILVFQYALIRYAPQKILKNELLGLSTALNFKEYKKLFLTSTEEAEKKSLKKERQGD